MALCRATCLRPFVSLPHFRPAAVTCRLPARRLLCSVQEASEGGAAAAASAPPPSLAAAAASAPPPPTAASTSAALAPKYASLPADQQRQIDAYVDILLEWNKNMNLTANTDREGAYERHVNDSLALLPAIDACLADQRQQQPQRQQQAARQQQAQQRARLPSRPVPVPLDQQWERAGGSYRPAASSGGRREMGTPAGQAAAAAAGADAAAAAAAAAGPRLVDVGSGAGLPGIILAIARPEWHFTLLDSLQKRCKFTEAAVAAAGVTNVDVHWGRAEDAGQSPAMRQQYDVAIARAVAELRVLSELCLPLVRVGGHWVAAKGPGPQAEVAGAGGAIARLGGSLLGLQEVDSQGPEGPRTAVVVQKIKQTPAQYPRKPGVPGKKPL